MPQLPMNYNNSLIYKICCNDISITDVYVGSTTNFIKRKSKHKSSCNKKGGKQYNQTVYQFIRSHGGWENWSMIVVEDFPCDSKNQLQTRERYHIELLHATLNKNIPTRTIQEWRTDNPDYNKEYAKNNAEKLKAQRKEYHQINAEKHDEKKAMAYR